MPSCPNCGFNLIDGVRFCTNCGSAVPEQQAEKVHSPVNGSRPETPAPAPYPANSQVTSYNSPQIAAQPQNASAQPWTQQYAPQSYAGYSPAANPSVGAPGGYTTQYYTGYQSAESTFTGAHGAYTPQVAEQNMYTVPGSSAAQNYTQWQYLQNTVSGTPTKKKKGKAVIIAVIAAVVLVLIAAVVYFAFFADSDESGTIYSLTGMTYNCMQLDMDKYAPEGGTLELKENGKGTITLCAESSGFTWSAKKENIIIKLGDASYSGSMGDGVVTLEIEGIVYTFMDEDAQRAAQAAAESADDEPEEAEPEDTEAETDEPEEEPEEDSEVGSFKVDTYTQGGKTIDLNEQEIELYIVLNKDGSGVICAYGTGAEISWRSGAIIIDGQKEPYTYSEGILTIGEGEENIAASRVESDTVPEFNMEDFAQLSEKIVLAQSNESGIPVGGGNTGLYGDWYGWWMIYDITDPSLKSRERAACDCYATMEENGDGTLTVYVWDEDTKIIGGTFELKAGYISFSEGYILDSDNVSGIIGMRVDGFNDLFAIAGDYTDPENPKYSFSFIIYMRPWGTLWNDMNSSALPPAYTWYIQMVNSDKKMPEGLYATAGQ